MKIELESKKVYVSDDGKEKSYRMEDILKYEKRQLKSIFERVHIHTPRKSNRWRCNKASASRTRPGVRFQNIGCPCIAAVRCAAGLAGRAVQFRK